MASQLGKGREILIRARDQQIRQGVLDPRVVRTYDFRGPWQGFTPDVPHSRADANFTAAWRNLVVRPSPGGRGEVLINDAGYQRVDNTNLPLGTDVNTGLEICHLAEFNFRNASGEETGATSDTNLAISEGDGSNAGSQELWRIHGSSTSWEEIPHSAAVGTAMQATIDGDTNQPSMVDSTEFPSGAPNRGTDSPTTSGDINTPAWIFTNNVDNVMVYPAADTNLTDYEELTDNFTNFKCISVQAFRDRCYFLNTVEGGTRVQNRIRRTGSGTCDPSTSVTGSGSIIIDELSTGLKLLELGDVLVAYFNDGVAFIRDTGNAAAPTAYQVLDVRRGLLGTHAAVNVGGIGHFGIYDDGWWLLDRNGRFRELGVAFSSQQQITSEDVRFSGGKQVQKWRRTFYDILDPDLGHRIHCTYDPVRHWVRIVVPTSSTTREVWTYDVDSDRVFRDEFPQPPTCFGEFTIRDTAADTWATVTGTWGDIVGTWAAQAAPAGNKRLVHGNSAGNVFFHDDDFFQQDGQNPAWQYRSIESNLGNPEVLKRPDYLAIEHINANNGNAARVTITDNRSGSSSQDVSLDQANTGDVELSEAWFTGPTGETLDFSLSGVGPIQIRSFRAKTVERQSERR